MVPSFLGVLGFSLHIENSSKAIVGIEFHVAVGFDIKNINDVREKVFDYSRMSKVAKLLDSEYLGCESRKAPNGKLGFHAQFRMPLEWSSNGPGASIEKKVMEFQRNGLKWLFGPSLKLD